MSVHKYIRADGTTLYCASWAVGKRRRVERAALVPPDSPAWVHERAKAKARKLMVLRRCEEKNKQFPNLPKTQCPACGLKF